VNIIQLDLTEEEMAVLRGKAFTDAKDAAIKAGFKHGRLADFIEGAMWAWGGTTQNQRQDIQVLLEAIGEY
jgi:hypothetical protein